VAWSSTGASSAVKLSSTAAAAAGQHSEVARGKRQHLDEKGVCPVNIAIEADNNHVEHTVAQHPVTKAAQEYPEQPPAGKFQYQMQRLAKAQHAAGQLAPVR